MKMLCYCFLSLAVFTCSHLFAIELYVATNGSDANAGTESQPLATLKGARDAIRKLRSRGNLNEGITVIIKQGTYFMNEPLLLTTEDAAPSNSPVTFTAAPNERVEFIRGIPIINLVKVNDRQWKTTVPEVARYGWRFEPNIFISSSYLQPT